MVCKFLKGFTIEIGEIGSAHKYRQNINGCELKASSKEMQVQIHNTLFEKGFGGSVLNNNCPVAKNEQWIECPWFKDADSSDGSDENSNENVDDKSGEDSNKN